MAVHNFLIDSIVEIRKKKSDCIENSLLLL